MRGKIFPNTLGGRCYQNKGPIQGGFSHFGDKIKKEKTTKCCHRLFSLFYIFKNNNNNNLKKEIEEFSSLLNTTSFVSDAIFHQCYTHCGKFYKNLLLTH
jgi:hypothetical protein